MDWFLYDNGLRQEWVNDILLIKLFFFLKVSKKKLSKDKIDHSNLQITES